MAEPPPDPWPPLASVCEGSTFANVGSGLPQLEANRQSRLAEALTRELVTLDLGLVTLDLELVTNGP